MMQYVLRNMLKSGLTPTRSTSPVPKVSEDHLAARRRQILDGARRCFAE